MDYEADLKGVARPRFGWALTGSGHFFKESLAIMRTLPNLDVFVSKAAAEVIRMYKQEFDLAADVRIFKDTTASAAPVGAFYYGVYHTLVMAPATSNTVAKCVAGISDNLATNVCSHVIRRQRWTPKRRRAWSKFIRAALILKTLRSLKRLKTQPLSRALQNFKAPLTLG